MTVSPDSATWDKNLYAYCDNNPVSRKDDGGQLWVQMLGGAAYGLATQFLGDLAYSLYTGQDLKDVINFGAYASAMVSGMVGAVAGPLFSNFVDVAVAPAIEQITNITLSEDKTWSWAEYGKGVACNAATSFASKNLTVDVPETVQDVRRDANVVYNIHGKKNVERFFGVKKAVSNAWNFISDAATTFFTSFSFGS